MQTTADLYVNDLIIKALQTIRVVTEFNAPTSFDFETGLAMLNELLASCNMNGSDIPFFYDISFDIVPGKVKYYFGQGPLADVKVNFLSEVMYLNLFWSNIMYPVFIITDFQALMTMKAENISYLPQAARVYQEQGSDGSEYTVVQLYNLPNQEYRMVMRAKKSLPQVKQQDYITDLPMYYREFLRLSIGEKCLPFYGNSAQWTPKLDQDLRACVNNIKASVKKDLDVKASQSLLPQYGRWLTNNIGVRNSI